MSHGPLCRASAALAFAGALVLTAGTWLRPSGTGPYDLTAAFGTYARADRAIWVVTHLSQLVGVVAMAIAVILLTGLISARNSALRRTVTALATTTMAVAAVLQAIDGVALKAMVDRWSSAAGGRRSAAFEAAAAVRQIEIGLGSAVACFAAATIVTFGLAVLHASAAVPSRITVGAATVGVGAANAAAGTAIALAGYSSMAILLTTVAVFATIVWAMLLGTWALRMESGPMLHAERGSSARRRVADVSTG